MGRTFSDKDWLSGPRLLTRVELLASGVQASAIDGGLRSGRLHHVFHGVYAVGHPSLTREERWLAAVLACGPGAALSHLSAGLLWALIGAERRRPDVSVPRSREAIGAITLHRRRRPPNTTTHLGIPVTTIAQTLVDLAATFAPRHLERAYTEAQLHPRFDRHELMELLEGPHRGVKRLRDLAAEDEGVGVPRNVMERRFLRIVAQTGLARPEMNAPWRSYFLDALWPAERIAVELDSRTYHQRKLDMQRDREKDRELQFAGLIALRFTAHEVMRHPGVVRAACLQSHALRG